MTNPTSSAGPLRTKYGGRLDEAINRAIRAECPGGNEALDTMTLIKQMLDRHGWTGPDGKPTPLSMAFRRVREIVEAMDEAVCHTYGVERRG